MKLPARALGELPGSELPRRFDLWGRVYEIEQTYRIVRQGPDCPPVIILPPATPPGGGVIIISGGISSELIS